VYKSCIQFTSLLKRAIYWLELRTNRRAIAMFIRHSVCPSVHLYGTCIVISAVISGSVISADLSLWLDSPMFRTRDTKACPPTPCRLFQFHLEERLGMDYGCANKAKN